MEAASISQIKASQIRPGANDRKAFKDLDKLATSIEREGLAQPPTLRPWPDGTYEIVAGERRCRAMIDVLHWDTIPAIIRPLADEEAAAIMLFENTARADLNPIEEAKAYQARIDSFGWAVARIAEVAGVSEERIARRLTLLKLVPEAQQLVASGNLGLGHAECLVALDNNRQRIALRILNTSEGVTVAKMRTICNQLQNEQDQEKLFDLAEFWVQQVKVEAPIIRRGKGARTGAPQRADTPQPTCAGSTDTAGAIFERYIAALVGTGFKREAEAVGNLYQKLVESNYVSIPDKREIGDKS